MPKEFRKFAANIRSRFKVLINVDIIVYSCFKTVDAPLRSGGTAGNEVGPPSAHPRTIPSPDPPIFASPTLRLLRHSHAHFHQAPAAALLAPSHCRPARSPISSPGRFGAGAGVSGGLAATARSRFSLLRPARTRSLMTAAGVAAGDDPAAATHPPSFHEDLTLVQEENEQLRATAGSLLDHRKVWGGEIIASRALGVDNGLKPWPYVCSPPPALRPPPLLASS